MPSACIRRPEAIEQQAQIPRRRWHRRRRWQITNPDTHIKQMVIDERSN
jgi:hypothetical protein